MYSECCALRTQESKHSSFEKECSIGEWCSFRDCCVFQDHSEFKVAGNLFAELGWLVALSDPFFKD